jgi:hypothetical protein
MRKCDEIVGLVNGVCPPGIACSAPTPTHTHHQKTCYTNAFTCIRIPTIFSRLSRLLTFSHTAGPQIPYMSPEIFQQKMHGVSEKTGVWLGALPCVERAAP